MPTIERNSRGFFLNKAISIEAIIGFIMMTVAGFGAWYHLQAKGDKNAQDIVYLKDSDALQKAELKDLRVEIRDSLKEIQRELKRRQ